jgi:hypothetical protein
VKVRGVGRGVEGVSGVRGGEVSVSKCVQVYCFEY